MCTHEHFESLTRIAHIVEEEGFDEVTGYWADLSIRCTQCGQSFEFIGAPGGLDFRKPTASVDGLELRIPIKPSRIILPDDQAKINN